MFPKALACKYSKYLEREVAKTLVDPAGLHGRYRTITLPYRVSFKIHLFKPWLERGEIPNRLQIMTSKMPGTYHDWPRLESPLLESTKSENLDILIDYYVLGQALEISELCDEVVCLLEVMRNLGSDHPLRTAPMAAHVRAYSLLSLGSNLCRLFLTDLVYEHCDNTSQSHAVEREAMIRALDHRTSQGVAILLSRTIDALLNGEGTVERGRRAIESIENRWVKGGRFHCQLHEHDDASIPACLDRISKLRKMAKAELEKRESSPRRLTMLPITDVFSVLS